MTVMSGRGAAAQVGDVKTRILEEAIELVALRGFTAITVREITEACGVNVAAVSYHFGSKDALLKQVMLSVFEPVRRARSDALALLLDRFAPEPAPVPDILMALIRPFVQAPRGRDGGRTIVRMMQHLRANQSDPIAIFVAQHYDYGAQGFIDALSRALPELSRSDLVWRYEFVRGAAIHMLTICDPISSKLKILDAGRGMIRTDDETILREISQCALTGILAPAT